MFNLQFQGSNLYRIPLEKLSVAQLKKKFTAFYGIQFTAVHTKSLTPTSQKTPVLRQVTFTFQQLFLYSAPFILYSVPFTYMTFSC